MTSRRLILCSLLYAAVLSLLLNSASLWTDEAFSAWLASHATLRSLESTLLSGGSSDLQMSLYYTYLFFWAKMFGTGELALRAANIPFILIFSFALVWASARVFKSQWAWLAPGMLPFVWHYAAEARPYMALLALSAATLAALLRFLIAPSHDEAKIYPWLCLVCVLVGSLFHMMFLLAALPLLLIALLAFWADPTDTRWRLWKIPLAVFAIPFCGLAAFLLFTFRRGVTDYYYGHPGISQMASVFYELAGFGGFGPNRKYSLDFHSHASAVAIGGLAILAGAAFAVYAAARRKPGRTLLLLGIAACFGAAEAVALSLAIGKQFDARHLAALVPIFLFLLMEMTRKPATRGAAALLLLGGAWLVSDLRAQFLPEYQKEDYRDAVRAVALIHAQTGADIAVAADPAAAAYYGLDVRGPAPCFPIQYACGPAFQQVPWQYRTPAVNADHWTTDRIQEWLENHRAQGKPVAVLLRTDRSHRRDSNWWPLLTAGVPQNQLEVHGFEIVVLNGNPRS